MVEQLRGTVLVTGAAKGIGHACVTLLRARGWHVLAGVRSHHDADALRGADVTPLLLDVTDANSIAQAAERAAERLGGRGLDGLVNNAGIAIAGPLEFLPIDALRLQLEVNVTGQIATTQAFLPLLRQARGRILFISSIAGRSALPFVGAYSASKFALEAAADALRIELAEWNLPVVLIEPGVIRTPIWETARSAARKNIAAMPPAALEYYGSALDAIETRMAHGLGGLPATAVAKVVERALTTRRPAPRYLIGRAARARLLLEALPDRARDAILKAGMRRLVGR
jgi:NAD(P)-dependent dehydrogenase (short-subunit alcohol dehydrogenase family)